MRRADDDRERAHWIPEGIRPRLILLSVGVLLPFLLLTAYLSWRSVEAERDRLRGFVVDEARERAADLDVLIVAWRQTLEVLGRTPALREHRGDEANQIFVGLVRTYPYLLNAAALDPDLTIWASAAPQIRGVQLSGEQARIARRVFDTGEPEVSGPVPLPAGRDQPVDVVLIRQPLRDLGGEVEGLLQVGLPLDTLHTALRLESMTPSNPVLIAQADGTVLASTGEQRLLIDGDGASASVGRAFRGSSGVMELRDRGGDEWLLGYQRAVSVPWYTVVATPKGAAFAGLQHIYLSSFLTLAVAGLLAALISRWLGRGIIRPIEGLVSAALGIANRDFSRRVKLGRDGEIAQVGAAFNVMAAQLDSAYRDLEQRVRERTAELETARQELQRLNEGLQRTVETQVDQINRTAQLKRYLSPQLAELLSSDRADIGGQTQRKDLTVMFADLRGFTTISEELEPEDLVELLKTYLTIMTEVVFAEGGTLDKYLGDGLMAFFGDPVSYTDHAERAVRAALRMRDRIAELTQQRVSGTEESLSLGVGITSGFVTVGTIGTPNRLEYTVIGNNVNLAARLAGLAGPGEVLCNARTAETVEGWAEVRNRGPDEIKGRKRPVVVFEIVGRKAPVPIPE